MSHHSVIKLPLKRIINNDFNTDKLNEIIIRTNKIVSHTLTFLKLYIIKLFKNKVPFPKIDSEFIMNIMLTISEKTTKGGRKPKNDSLIVLDNLNKFYEKHYKPLINETKIKNDNLTRILQYEAQLIVTCITNNIKEHYIKHIRKYLNIVLERRKHLKDKERIKNIDTIIRDILSMKSKLSFSSNEYLEFINLMRSNIFDQPNKKSTELKFAKNSLYYDLEVHPLKYLPYMCNIQLLLENMKRTNIDCKKLKTINILPLRRSIIPKNITLDTTSIIDLFYKGEIEKNTLRHDIVKYKDELWRQIINLDHKLFNKKKYMFDGLIKTDGISVSITFTNKKNKKGEKRKKRKKKFNENEKETIKYIDNLENYEDMRNKKIICIDPGHDDIIYSVSNLENITKYKYSQPQRKVETKTKKYKKILETKKKEHIIEDKNICEIEETIKTDSKTISFSTFKKYIKEKYEACEKIYDFYENKLFRKLKLNSYINTGKSEGKMIRNFNKRHEITNESKEETLIILGDYSRTDSLKHSEPVITKKIRKIFEKNNYNLYLIDEYKTSQICHKCESTLEHKEVQVNGKLTKIWKILCCTNKDCKTYHNRDFNSCMNMHKIVDSYIGTYNRPEVYKRTTVNAIHT